MTVRDLIAGALKDLGVLAQGEAVSADDVQHCLLALQNLIDSWSNSSLFVYNRVNHIFTLASSKQTYTLGSGGDFDAPRPKLIQVANWVETSQTPSFEIGIDIYTVEQWAEITVKNLQGTIPFALYYDKAFPLMNLNFWPIPAAGKQISLWNWEPLTNFSTVGDTVSLPEGYPRLIQKNLAVEIAPSYSKSVSPELLASAQDSLSQVKTDNTRPSVMKVDEAITQNLKPYSIWTGWSGR